MPHFAHPPNVLVKINLAELHVKYAQLNGMSHLAVQVTENIVDTSKASPLRDLEDAVQASRA
jgi:hypothetical protein